MPTKRHFILMLICLLASCGTMDETRPADTVLMNGKIITVDPNDSIAEAVAISEGKILAVGSNEEIEALAGADTRRIDLKGLTATPGLIDSHCHFAAGGVDMLYVLDLSYPLVTKMEDVVLKVKASVEALQPGEWVQGRGWDEGKLSELRHIFAADLDPVSPDNPVWLTHTMGHYGTANSLALKLANVTKDTPDPPGGTIDRRPDGSPTGVLKESAMSLVSTLIPDVTPEQERKGIKRIVDGFNQEGMTAVKDPVLDLATWEAYQDVLADGDLTVRTVGLWRVGDTEEEAQMLLEQIEPFTKPTVNTGDDRLISGGAKIFIDGSGGARTAWVHEEWNKNFDEVDSGNYGYTTKDPDILRKQITLFHNAGIHVSSHAIGDRAIDWTVDSYALALEGNPIHGLRHGIIHCNVPTDHAIETMAELQKTHDAGYPEASPTFMWWIGDTYAGNWGPERCRRLNPFKTFLDKGMIWGGASDFSVTPFPVRYGLWAAIVRETLLGVYGSNPYGMEESVDIHTALRSYTSWNARQLFLEDKIGSLEVGKYADIAVWDTDLYTASPEAIKEMKCQLTLLGGEIVYQADETPISVAQSR